jgi:tRNA threonylcarbamoyladenosine biosynthesis protein TsaE
VVPPVREQVLVPTGAQMRALGQRLAGLLRAGDLVVLTGPLGAGKTTLVQGIGRGLDVRGPVTSPTFVIARVHPSLRGGPALVHADAYRLGSRAEVDDLDLDADLDGSVTVVEWGEGLVEELAPSYLEITIAMAPAGDGAGLSAAGPDAAGPDAAGPDAAGPDAAGPDAAGADAAGAGLDAAAWDEPADEPRVVRLTGTGSRWEAAAQAARMALSGWPGNTPETGPARTGRSPQ